MLNLERLTGAITRVAAYLARAAAGDLVPNEETLKAGAEVVREGAKFQKTSRRAVVRELQQVCKRVDDGIAALSDALKPARAAATKGPQALAAALAGFDHDGKIRARFKPEGLCSEVDHLLVSTRSWLESIRWTWGLNEITLLQEELTKVQNLDAALQHEYDQAVDSLHSYANRIVGATGKQQKAVAAEAVAFLDILVDPLRDCAKRVRAAKDKVTPGKR